MPKLTIITIHKGPIINLKKTLNSVSNQNKYPNEQIIISPKLPKYIKDNYNKKFLKFIIGKDKSIYNAMNIGLRLASSENILFLNSGDEFATKGSVSLISSKLNNKNKKVIIFKILLKYENLTFIPKKKYFYSSKYFPHPVFVAPLNKNKNKIFFDENNKTISDSVWIKKNISKFKYYKIYKNLVVHYLGGISTKPTFQLALEKSQISYLEFGKEIIKIFLYNIMTKKKYYKLIFSQKYNLINE